MDAFIRVLNLLPKLNYDELRLVAQRTKELRLRGRRGKASIPVRCAVYRAYDHKDLLYVGVAEDWALRWYQHSRNAEFFKLVRQLHIEWYDSRGHALAREHQLIHDFRPAFNKAGLPA